MVATRRPFLALSAGFALLVFVPAVPAQDDLYRPELTAKVLDRSCKTDWYGVYVQNKKIGYSRHERKREDGTIVDAAVWSLKIVSMGTKVEFSAKQTLVYQDKAPYRMLRGTLIESLGVSGTTTTFNLNARGNYDSVHEVAGQKRAEEIKGIDYTLADALATEIWLQKNPKIGDVIRARAFDVSDPKMDVETSKLLSSKESLAGGVQVRFFEVETQGKLRPIKMVNRFDDQGETLSAVVGFFEVRRETEEQAKNIEYSQDLFVLGQVK